ncbi:MAG: hypothetical protein ABI464_13310 [Chthoniobacteraceae bacterium]
MSGAAETRKSVVFSELPAVVQRTIQKQAGSAPPAEIKRVEEDGEVSFEMAITAGGRERDIVVGEDGSLWSVEVTLAETPAAIQKAVKAQVGAGTLVSVDKIFDEGETSYDVVMTAKDGKERAFTVEGNGTISSLEVALAETPAAVQKTVTGQVGAGKLDGIARIFAETTSYDVGMTAADGKQREFSVGADGKLLSIRVTLDETSPEVQRTIREQIGSGKIVRIDKSFERRSKTLPYEVEAIRNGKPFYFSVGAAGKFLGVDE